MNVEGTNLFNGLRLVLFTFGAPKVLDLSHAVFDTAGRPIYLVDKDHTVYNFNNVISISRSKDA